MMGLEALPIALVVWGVLQLLAAGALGFYAHRQALAARDALSDVRRLHHALDAAEVELKASRAANKVLRKAAHHAGIDTSSLLDAVRDAAAERTDRMLQPARDEDRLPGDPEEADPSVSSDSGDIGVSDPGSGDRPRSGL